MFNNQIRGSDREFNKLLQTIEPKRVPDCLDFREQYLISQKISIPLVMSSTLASVVLKKKEEEKCDQRWTPGYTKDLRQRVVWVIGDLVINDVINIILEYTIGTRAHIYMGSNVDVQDVLGKWVFAKIIDIREYDSNVQENVKALEKARAKMWNCPTCSGLNSLTSQKCIICGAIRPKEIANENVNQELVEEAAYFIEADFYGWGADFREWVPMARVSPGGTMLKTWLYPGNIVIARSIGSSPTKCGRNDTYMCRVMETKTDQTDVMQVKIKAAPDVKRSFETTRPYKPVKEELDGRWVKLTEGFIFENGSFT